MAKFHGKIGYIKTEETEPGSGVYTEIAMEFPYVGDILRSNLSWERNDNLNDDLNVSNRFSIVADAFAYENFPYIRYVTWMGSKWKVNSVEIQRPRLILTVGGVYNG